MELRIRAAHPDDVERLREIAFAAKGHWGYDSARVRQWADAYDFCALLHSHTVFVAQAGDANLAWASLSSPDGGVAGLDDLWVDPAWMGKGVGSQLFYAACE